jgi:ATPase subunit of ABC transporter with duplicated ATPase domains
MAEYVFTLRNVRKAHGDKVVLDNVTLSFLHGAKIGVVGPNGTGKSTLLKIMAGSSTRTTVTRSSTPARPWACSSRSRR